MLVVLFVLANPDLRGSGKGPFLDWWQVKHRNYFPGCQDQCPDPPFLSDKLRLIPQNPKDFSEPSHTYSLYNSSVLRAAYSLEHSGYVYLPSSLDLEHLEGRGYFLTHTARTELQTPLLCWTAGNVVALNAHFSCLIIPSFSFYKHLLRNLNTDSNVCRLK